MTKKATSVIEAMVIMLIIVTGVVGMYKIYIESIRLSDVTEQRIQAIQIAREGLEAMENIRNTNWILYGADYKNCWNTLNYNNQCVGWDVAGSIPVTDIASSGSGSYIIYQNNDLRWQLDEISSPAGTFGPGYINQFEVGKINNFYTQTGSYERLRPQFTREIQLSYPGGDSNASSMNVTSLVQWKGQGDTPHRVRLDLVLTNWKGKN